MLRPLNPNACESCRFWSESIADNGGPGGTLRAMCLQEQSPLSHTMTTRNGSCGYHASGDAIDARPPARGAR